jgi:hypothetical protein
MRKNKSMDKVRMKIGPDHCEDGQVYGQGNDDNYLLTYDSYGPVHNRFHSGKCITCASGGGRGPRTLLGP